MAQSPSGSRAAAPSTGDEAFTDAGAEDVGDSRLSALLFGTITSSLNPRPLVLLLARSIAARFSGRSARSCSPLLLNFSRRWGEHSATALQMHPDSGFSFDPLQMCLDRLGPDAVCDVCTPVTDGSEIERCDSEIEAAVVRAREAVAEKSRALDDDRERVQKAALAALDILSGGRGAI
ncbi:hypothetical protein HU200_019506 [Digitaria exilis]|uniref:Uncharacterized protein n=1 Tax=Digitaria exilis TaxID=1010633 RepID=A0A835F3C3_9POAL|nr:hypothetical protein HU200_019506 [Digitaria exilis]